MNGSVPVHVYFLYASDFCSSGELHWRNEDYQKFGFRSGSASMREGVQPSVRPLLIRLQAAFDPRPVRADGRIGTALLQLLMVLCSSGASQRRLNTVGSTTYIEGLKNFHNQAKSLRSSDLQFDCGAKQSAQSNIRVWDAMVMCLIRRPDFKAIWMPIAAI